MTGPSLWGVPPPAYSTGLPVQGVVNRPVEQDSSQAAEQQTPTASPARQALYALTCALLSALLLNVAMPGLAAWRGQALLLPCCLCPLLLAVRLWPRWAALAGLLFGVSAYCGQLNWIVIVLGRYGGLPPWLSWPALLLLSFYMALYSMSFCLLLSWIRRGVEARRSPHALALALWTPPVVWTGLDALRGVLFTGFPWMDLGYGLFRTPFLLLPADLGGHHLLTFALVLCNAALALTLHALCAHVPRRKALMPLATAALFLALLTGYSLMRLMADKAEIAEASHIHVGFVQGNISQDLKWTEAFKQETLTRYLRLSAGLVEDGDVDLVVWPETALPFYPQDDPLTWRVVAFAAKGPQLLLGAPLYQVEENREGQIVRHFNGALLLGRDGQVLGSYHKQHLVPFGEYIPLKELLFFLEPLVVNIGNFAPGLQSGPLAPEGNALRPGLLICYESVFPAIAQKSTAQGANLLVNLTNDAWYGYSSAPVQSLAMTVLRAVENRRALVRAANTGISGFVDPLGRIRGETPLFTELAATERLPLIRSRTLFSRGGHAFGFFCALLILPLLTPLLFARLDRRLQKNRILGRFLGGAGNP